MRRFLTIGSALVLGLGPAACGGDEEASGPDVERYCELVTELDAASEEDPDPETPEEAEKLLSDLVKDNDDRFDEIVEVAPEEISADVAKLIAAIRKGADGDLEAMGKVDDTKITEFEEKNCKE